MMLVLSAFTLVETIILKVLILNFPTPPLWIQKFSDFLQNSQFMKYLKYLLASPFDEKDEYENFETKKASEKKSNEWKIFCRFIDRIIFIAFILCFTIYNGY